MNPSAHLPIQVGFKQPPLLTYMPPATAIDLDKHVNLFYHLSEVTAMSTFSI